MAPAPSRGPSRRSGTSASRTCRRSSRRRGSAAKTRRRSGRRRRGTRRATRCRGARPARPGPGSSVCVAPACMSGVRVRRDDRFLEAEQRVHLGLEEGRDRADRIAQRLHGSPVGRQRLGQVRLADRGQRGVGRGQRGAQPARGVGGADVFEQIVEAQTGVARPRTPRRSGERRPGWRAGSPSTGPRTGTRSRSPAATPPCTPVRPDPDRAECRASCPSPSGRGRRARGRPTGGRPAAWDRRRCRGRPIASSRRSSSGRGPTPRRAPSRASARPPRRRRRRHACAR